MTTDPESAVREVLANIVGPGLVNRIQDNEKIFERRIVDSLHLIELLERLEQRFGIVVDGEDLIPEHFESIAAMGAFVRRKVA